MYIGLSNYPDAVPVEDHRERAPSAAPLRCFLWAIYIVTALALESSY